MASGCDRDLGVFRRCVKVCEVKSEERGRMMDFPVVRIEIEHMRRTIMACLTEQLTSLDSDIRAAVEEQCSDDRVKEVIAESVRREIHVMEGMIERTVAAEVGGLLRRTIEEWFRTGDGREMIQSVFKKVVQ